MVQVDLTDLVDLADLDLLADLVNLKEFALVAFEIVRARVLNLRRLQAHSHLLTLVWFGHTTRTPALRAPRKPAMLLNEQVKVDSE